MGRNSIFKQIGALHLRKHKYVLNYHKYFDCDAGQLIPVAFEECVPGDIVKIGNEALVRVEPMLKPIFGKLTYHTYSFFVPTAIMFGTYKEKADGTHVWVPDRTIFEQFLSRGVDGTDKSVSLPYWVPTGSTVRNDAYYEWTVTEEIEGVETEVTKSSGEVADNGIGSLWDYFGLPIGVIPKVNIKDEEGNVSEMDAVLNFPRIAYNIVYSEFFRDQNLMDYVDVQNSSIVRNKCWKKDLFTSALPWQQRGTSPALPVNITGSAAAVFTPEAGSNTYINTGSLPFITISPQSSTSPGNSIIRLYGSSDGSSDEAASAGVKASVDLSGLSTTTFNVADLRAAFQVQKWLERSARSGTRMKEILLAHFGEAPSDEVLQRPYFIGHTSAPIFISEVLQTSESTEDSAQGNLSGHGVSASRNYAGSFHAKEFGYILTLACIVPETSYSQGINRQFSKFSRWDYMWPETLFLSEEGVRQMEIFADPLNDPDENATLFGFQSRFYELRSRQNMFCGSFRDDMDFWHMGREFENAPQLNESFVKMVPTKRIFASIEKPGFLVDHFNVHTWYRPLPYAIEPGLIDHM